MMESEDHIFMPREKKHHLPPRRKRMTRQARLDSARATRWVEKYAGKNIIKTYGKWFAVDPLCAVIELRMLGVKVVPEREDQIKATIEARRAARLRRKQSATQAEFEKLYADSDDTFAYIAGYTPGGAPYGVTWEELGEEPLWLDHDEDEEGIEQSAAADLRTAARPKMR
jgi:hypothetical protein